MPRESPHLAFFLTPFFLSCLSQTYFLQAPVVLGTGYVLAFPGLPGQDPSMFESEGPGESFPLNVGMPCEFTPQLLTSTTFRHLLCEGLLPSFLPPDPPSGPKPRLPDEKINFFPMLPLNSGFFQKSTWCAFRIPRPASRLYPTERAVSAPPLSPSPPTRYRLCRIVFDHFSAPHPPFFHCPFEPLSAEGIPRILTSPFCNFSPVFASLLLHVPIIFFPFPGLFVS